MSSADLLAYTEDQKLSILKAYGKTPETVAEDVEKLKEWLEKQPHLPKDVSEERLLEGFLMLNKFRMQQTKEKLDCYYTVRSLIPEFYTRKPSDPDLLKYSDVFYFITLPKLTKDYERVTLTKLREVDALKFEMIFNVIYALHLSEVRVREDYFLSQIIIIDFEGIKINYVTAFTPSLLKKAMFVFEKVFAGRVSAFHYVNVPGYVDSFMSLFKSFLKPKLAKRIHTHKDYESLFKVVQKDIIPKDLGGEERPLEELHEAWKQKIFEYQGTLEKLLDLKVNEALRPEKSSYNFGLDGNFRKLQID